MTLVENLSERLVDGLSRSWWLLLLRAILAILFGIFLLTQPGLSLATLILIFGCYAIGDGLVDLFAAITNHGDGENRWLGLLRSLASIAVGIVTLTAPGLSALVLLFYIAFRAMAVGILEIVTAIRLRKVIEGEWALILMGVVSVFFGLFVLARPGDGAIALLSVIGIYSLFIGVALLVVAFRVKGFAKKVSARMA